VVTFLKIGERLVCGTLYYGEYLDILLWILSYGDLKKYSELKVKYLNPCNSKIYEYGFLDKKDFDSDTCVFKEKNIARAIYTYEIKRENSLT
jgi:hypothetical protein